MLKSYLKKKGDISNKKQAFYSGQVLLKMCVRAPKEVN